jgi:hypothetical protein
MNFVGILLLLVVAVALIGLPSLIIQSIWNTAFERTIERDMSIVIWQAALLWASLLTVLYSTGIFKFQIDFRTIENVDISDIDDPELRAEIEKIKAINKELRSQEISQDSRKSD